jgi:uncharacterized membrane protein
MPRQTTKEKKQSSGKALTIAGVVAGAALAGYGLSRRDRKGLVLAGAGGALIAGGTATSMRGATEIAVENTVSVNRPAAELYEFWSDVRNIPKFFQNVFAVTVLDSNHSEWAVRGLPGHSIRWISERVEDLPNLRIGWHSTADSAVTSDGVVEFMAHEEHGTEVKLTVRMHLPGGAMGKLAAKALGGKPSLRLKEDLRRFKQIMEAGEIPTTEGQPSGKRGPIGSLAEALGWTGESAKANAGKHSPRAIASFGAGSRKEAV